MAVESSKLIVPASPAQAGMWFLNQLAPDSLAYNVPWSVSFDEGWDPQAAELTVRELVARHDALRSTYTAGADGRVLQVVSPEVEVPIALADIGGGNRTRAVATLAQDLFDSRFDLETGPVARAAVVTTGPGTGIILFCFHHIAIDGWSLNVLGREARVLMRRWASGVGAPLVPPASQYTDFARRQAEAQSSGALEESLGWWRRRLAGAPPLPDLPLVRPRTGAATFRGESTRWALPVDLAAAVESTSRTAGATVFMTLLAAFSLLLHRYTRQDDFVLGSWVAGRVNTGEEEAVGLFANTVLLRADVGGDPTFAELLSRTREMVLSSMEHQDVRIETLVQELAPVRDPSYMPLCQVVFNHQNFPEETLAARRGRRRTNDAVVRRRSSKYDLVLYSVGEGSADGLELLVEYASDLFDDQTITRMLSHYEQVLREVTAEPELRVSQVHLLSPSERRHLAIELNQTEAPAPRHATITSLFAEQARRTPAGTALIHLGQPVSYAELDRLAGRVAAALDRRGIGRGDVVAVCAPRSPQLVAAMLGAMRVGAAYLPLDPGYPRPRLEFMLADSTARAVLTTTALAATGVAGQTPAILLDQERGLPARPRPGHDAAAPGGAAYVIYTSGSTGRPKGVAGTHLASVNRFAWMWRTYPFAPGEVGCQKTAISFVDSIWEIFGPLLRGVPSVIVPDETGRDPRALISLMAAHRVSRLVAVPSLLRAMVDAEPALATALPDLRVVVSSGEALAGDLAARLVAAHPGCRLLNLYGSSEVAGDATFHEVVRPDPAHPVPIGRPIANVEVHVLDDYGHHVPMGIPGEVHVAGDALAMGYLHRPDLTAERFIEIDVMGAPKRAYRTGDLARIRVDGTLDYAGRVDHQVKIRGVRVEPGEVEATLKEHPAVTAALVVAREYAPGDVRLVAYLTAPGAARLDLETELRAHVAERLAEQGRPSAYVVLDGFPLTPNGKVDRLALPPPAALERRQSVEPPRNRREAQLAAIFAEVLGVEGLGVNDDFFRLGGHSLLAAQVAARVRSDLAIEMPLVLLFEAPTVAALADRLDRAAEVAPEAAIARRALSRAPATHAQRRLWFLDQLAPGSTAYHIMQTFRFESVDPEILRQALNHLVARHASLRTTFQAADGEPEQVVADALEVYLPVTDVRLLNLAEQQQETRRVGRQAFRQAFDLARGPLIRGQLVIQAQSALLFLCVHHIVSDGWSMNIIDRELRTAYSALEAGERPSLPPLEVQYSDYAAWQRSEAESARIEGEVEHWTRRLAGAPELLRLPTDRPRPPAPSQRGERLFFLLPRTTRDAVERFSHAHGATIYMTLLAAFKAVLNRWSGETDLVVGTPVAGRTSVETERLVGMFVNTLALRTDVSGNPTFAELVDRVRATTLDAFGHQDVPFERLVSALATDRDMSRAPLFQVMFVLQNTRRAVSTLRIPQRVTRATLRRVHWAVEGIASKFDLTLTAWEQPAGIRLQVEYATDLFDAETMRRFMANFGRLVEAAVRRPQTPIGELPVLSDGEERRLAAWNSTRADLGPEWPLGEGFEAAVRAHRREVALATSTARFTYGELDRAVNRLANHLAAAGVRRADRVGICMERTPEMVISLLAVVKLGAAYVPLDPTFPAGRLAFMLEDSGARLCLTAGDAADLSGTPCPVINLDLERSAIAARPATRPRRRVHPTDAAYVLYTSGSTGRPKGVVVEHRQVLNYSRAVARRTGATAPGIAYAMLQPLTVDSSVTVLWGSLLGAGRLVLVSREEAADPNLLARLFRRQRIDYLKIAPSHLRALHGGGRPRALLPRRWLVIGGEGSNWDWVRTLPAIRPRCRVFNHYGPTETTVGVTMHRVRAGDPGQYEITPIGSPLANVRAYVLDSHGNPAPIGVAGELHFAGACVARGYLNRPELDAERFVADPFVPGERMYRTGDLARWLPTGAIEFLGRLDHQVKIRGFRIELGEIESALAAHQSVAEAMVLAPMGPDGHRRLVAWVSPAPGAKRPTAGLLRTHLRRDLPDYMVPVAFTVMDELPRTPHGKVDLKALPMPDLAARQAAREHVAPRNEAERAMARLWAGVLGIDRVSADANFFELGGHSLLATQLISRIRDRFAVEVPLRAIFEQPTVAGLAAMVVA